MKWLGSALLFLLAAFLAAVGVMFLLYAWNVGGWYQDTRSKTNYMLSGFFMLAVGAVAAYYSHKFFSASINFSEEMLAEIAETFKQHNGFLSEQQAMQVKEKFNPKHVNRYYFLLRQEEKLILVKEKKRDALEDHAPIRIFFYIPHYQKNIPLACPFCKQELKFKGKEKTDFEKFCPHCSTDISFLQIK